MISTILAACPAGSFNAECLDDISAQVPGYKARFFDLGTLISADAFSLVSIIFYVGGIALLINLVLAGVGLMSAAGEPSKITAGKERIKNGFLGLGLLLTAYFIVQIVGTLLGLKGITSEF